jgi:YHS domain-containing protein
MKKIIVVALLLAFMMPVAASQAVAAEDTAQAGIVDAGNKLCPVSGDPVSGQDFVVYNGKSYGLCCPMCERPFLKDPEKYLAALAEKEKALSENKTGADAGHEGMHHM